jgi:CDP-diacylglycerol--glycerol-3-phosphate 3-phosphatidyltransferase
VTLAACAISWRWAWACTPLARRAKRCALIPLWMFVRMAFNAIDGMLAREFGQASKLGAC